MTKTHVLIRNVQYFSHDHIIIVSSQEVSNAQPIIVTLDHCHPIASSPDQSSYARGVTRCLHVCLLLYVVGRLRTRTRMKWGKWCIWSLE